MAFARITGGTKNQENIQNSRGEMKKKIQGVMFVVVLFILPFILRDSYLVHVLTVSCIYAVLVLSWDILSGYGGMFSFGHPLFFGLGGYASALLVMRLGISPWLGLLFGGMAAGLIGFVIGLPVLRLKGAYLAIVTLSFMIIIHSICVNWTSLTQGATGLSGIPPLSNFDIFGIEVDFDGTDRTPYYYVAAFILAISTYIQNRFVNSPIGIHLLAIREDEEAAVALGVNSARCKLVAFVLTSFLAGVVGGFHGHFIMLLSPSVFGFDVMISIMTMSLLGGAGTTLGPIAGAFILTFLSEYLREFGSLRLIMYGLFIMLAISFMPQGILRSLWESSYFRRVKLLFASFSNKLTSENLQ